MNEIKCPKCGEVFQVDASGYAAIVQQVRDAEFGREVAVRAESFEKEKKSAVALAKNETEKAMQEALAEKERRLAELTAKLQATETQRRLAVMEASAEKDKQIAALQLQLDAREKEYLLDEKTMREQYEQELRLKDEEVALYRDFKARQSTKMLGESLEQHCLIEFNRLRPTGFQNAYFEKDNDIRTGSKGDFIFRDYDDNGVEFISIMFEMKNEADTTKTKHKNEDFFKELDKDRREKNCEYAVLVSLLEGESELYNTGIVDVSYRYEKMYVIRPQFFIPMITLLRNAALNSLSYRQELAMMQSQNVDITHFEENIEAFKKGFARNYELAKGQFATAIEEIDKSIEHLQKIKVNLQKSENNLRLANHKAEDLTIKRLTKNSPSMAEKFAALKQD